MLYDHIVTKNTSIEYPLVFIWLNILENVAYGCIYLCYCYLPNKIKVIGQ